MEDFQLSVELSHIDYISVKTERIQQFFDKKALFTVSSALTMNAELSNIKIILVYCSASVWVLTSLCKSYRL